METLRNIYIFCIFPCFFGILFSQCSIETAKIKVLQQQMQELQQTEEIE